MHTEILKVAGMTSKNCTEIVTQALKTLNGVSDVWVSLARSEATIQFDENLVSGRHFQSALSEAGYGIAVSDGGGSCCGGCGGGGGGCSK
jgi:copper chaperone CopZ